MRLPPSSITRPAGVLTVPFGVVEVCQAGDELAPSPSRTRRCRRCWGRRRRRRPSSPISSASSTIATHRRAGALGDVDGVAEVVAVAVREQDRVGGDARRPTPRPSGCRSGTGRSGRSCRRRTGAKQTWPRKRMSISHVLRCRRSIVSELAGQLEADRDADQHRRGASPRRAASAPPQALLDVGLAARPRAPAASCAASNQPPSSSAWSRMRCSAGARACDELLGLREPLRVGERRDGGVDLGVGVVRGRATRGASYERDGRAAHLALPRRGLRLQAPAAALRPIVAGLPAPDRPARARRLRDRPTTPASSAHATSWRSCRPSTSSRRSSTTRTTSAGSRRRNALSRRLRDGRHAGQRAEPRRLPARDARRRRAARDPARRRATRSRPRARAIVGGHSIDDPEPKYGLAVTGVVHPDEVLTNAGGRAGDALVLTKPLGAGAVSTAVKRGLAADRSPRRSR